MQINIDRKTGVLLGVIVLLAAAVVSLSVNRNENNVMNNSSGHMGHGSSSSSNANYTGDDIMFLQMMIPHHQQAIDISNIALKSSKNVELLALADTIIEDQTAEIVQMTSWLKEAGASMDMGHSMSGMGGMLDEAELSALAVAKGKEFDALWLKGMIEHHDGAIDMSSMIADASNPEIKAFGENVIEDQSAQIDQMNAMLKRIS